MAIKLTSLYFLVIINPKTLLHSIQVWSPYKFRIPLLHAGLHLPLHPHHAAQTGGQGEIQHWGQEIKLGWVTNNIVLFSGQHWRWCCVLILLRSLRLLSDCCGDQGEGRQELGGTISKWKKVYHVVCKIIYLSRDFMMFNSLLYKIKRTLPWAPWLWLCVFELVY